MWIYLLWTLAVLIAGVAALWSGEGGGGADPIGIVALAGLAILYPLPAFIAWWRAHPSTGPIALLDLVLGWTGIGWLLALLWSLTRPSDRPLEQASVDPSGSGAP